MEFTGFKKIDKDKLTIENFTFYFSENIKYLMSETGLTRYGFSLRTGLGEKKIGSIIERRAVGIENVYKVSRAFGYSIDELITGLIK